MIALNYLRVLVQFVILWWRLHRSLNLIKPVTARSFGRVLLVSWIRRLVSLVLDWFPRRRVTL